MTGRDVDSSPVEYRTWVIDGYPDYDAEYYSGIRGGTNDFADIAVHQVPTAITFPVDFNLPDPTTWSPARGQLPDDVKLATLAVIDGYVYLFGGMFSNKIYRAPTGRPMDFVDTNATLPTPLYGAQFALIDGYAYLFGGNNGVPTDTVFSAPETDPLTWTNHGSILPKPLYDSQLILTGYDGYVYLLGGKSSLGIVDDVLYASVTSPLTWNTHGQKLPAPLCGSSASIIAGTVYMFGGNAYDGTGNLPSDRIHSITISDLISGVVAWQVLAATLPHTMEYAQFITIGSDGYLFGTDKERAGSWIINPTPYPHSEYVETGDETYYTKIFYCNLTNPTSWIKLPQIINAQFYQSQLAIIYDRLFLYGCNGGSYIYASNPVIKYNFNLTSVANYSNITRILYPAIADPLDRNLTLCFPYWKTDY